MGRAAKTAGKRPKDTTTGESRWMPIGDLKAYDRNTRTHSPEQLQSLAESLETFGWVKPALVQEDGTIVAGHGIVQAAEQAGYTEAKVLVVTGMTAAQIRAYVIADNKLALNAGWDPELLSIELNELEADGFTTKQLGFSDEDVARILDDADEERLGRGSTGGGGGGKGDASEHETFTTPLSALDLAALRLAIKKAKTRYGVDTTGAALMAIVNAWNEE